MSPPLEDLRLDVPREAAHPDSTAAMEHWTVPGEIRTADGLVVDGDSGVPALPNASPDGSLYYADAAWNLGGGLFGTWKR